MRVIIAGSRGLSSYEVVEHAVASSGFDVTTVVSGGARGADRLGEKWAENNGAPVARYLPDWDAEPRAAGHIRNRVMADNADALVAVWDGSSPGTRGMIEIARAKGLPTYVRRTDTRYTAYCDGASRKDGRGGWGASIRGGEKTIDIYGGEVETTNNRMELMACIETLWYLPPMSIVEIVCDSQYVVKGFTEHLEMWLRARWRTSANGPVANRDLWEELQFAVANHALVEWRWVKGHSGNEGNERADQLATMGVPERQEIFVFGSNLAGRHGAGAAKAAAEEHGAQPGVGHGLTGRAYAIPTKDGVRVRDLSDPRAVLPLDRIRGYVTEFLDFARTHKHMSFNVTRVGCGRAGYSDEEIAPMFAGAPVNCILPPEWVEILGKDGN